MRLQALKKEEASLYFDGLTIDAEFVSAIIYLSDKLAHLVAMIRSNAY